MKNAKLLLSASMVLLVMIGARGQQPTLTDEGQIQRHRTNIQRLIANAPPADAPTQADFRSTLQNLRNQLRDLLIEKRGALKNRIQNLEAPEALPEVLAHVQQLKIELQGVNGEVQALSQELGQDLGSLPRSAPAPTPKNDNPPPLGFEEAVKKLSAEDLKSAAAPAEVATSALVACNDRGRPAVTTFSIYDENVCALAIELNDDDRPIVLAQDLNAIFTILTAKLLKTKTSEGESYASFVSQAQEARTDQQMGAGPSSAGTTSLVVKGGVPYVLGLAVENGAATESRSGTTLTFRINPAGLLNTFANKGFITGFREAQKDPVMNFLRKTSIGLSFDTDRGNQAGVFTGDKKQLSSVSARVEFVNERDPRHKKYEADWEMFVANQGVKLADQVWNTTVATVDFGDGKNHKAFRDPALQAWLNQMNESIAKVSKKPGDVDSINAVARVIREHADLVPVTLVSEQTIEAITGFAKQDKEYTEQKNKLFDRIAKGRVFTLEYTNKREVNAPDTSNFNFIAATGTAARVDLTTNGSFTFFNKLPAFASSTSPRPGRVRDFQFAGQVDIPFKVGDGQFDFWFSGRYERLLTDASTLAGTTMPGTRGDIAVGQFGLNIPIKSLGIKFPISFTFANRTELVKEKEIRGNFGFTFNWDTILSKLKPF